MDMLKQVARSQLSHQRGILSKALFALIASFVFLGSRAWALDLQLPDRLDTPAKQFSDVWKTPMLGLQNLGSRLIAVGDRGVITFSDDQGESWQQAQVPISSLLTSVYFANEQLGWAVGHGGSILTTQDGGNTWRLQLDGRKINDLMLKNAQQRLASAKQQWSQASSDEKDDYQYAVEDAEFVLSNAQFDQELGPSNPLLDVFFLNEQTGFVVGAYGLFLMTDDGGQRWQSIAMRLENFDRYHLNTITQLEGGGLLIAGEAGTLFASYDQGLRWETLYGPYQGSYFGVQATGKPQQGLLYGLKGHVFRTENAGQSWEEIATDVETSLTASSLSRNGRLAVVGLSGVVLISDDQGKSFSRVPTKGFESFTAVEFIGNNTLLLVSDEGVQRLSIN